MSKIVGHELCVPLEGGNLYDDLRVDIESSHRQLDREPRIQNQRQGIWIGNFFKLNFSRASVLLGLTESLALNGFRRKWLLEFHAYWRLVLNGRTLWGVSNFFALAHEYRKKQQHVEGLNWGSPSAHLKNWQHPSELYSTFRMALKDALLINRGLLLPRIWNKVPRHAKILEYGCSLAPYYSTYRQYFSHLRCRWVLADIPNFPFHYAKIRYWNDPAVEFLTIYEENFQNPLGGERDFDVVILKEVLEHLDEPLFVTELLLSRLKIGGLFIFDYVKSDALGLDHPKSLGMRKEVLALIIGQVEILHGDVSDLDSSIGFCIARKL